MKKKFLFTLVMAVSLCVGVQAQEFRYGLSGGYNYNSTKESISRSGFHAGLKGEYAFREAAKGLYADMGLMISSYGWKSVPYYVMNERTYEYESTPYYLHIPIHLGYKLKVGRNVIIGSLGRVIRIGAAAERRAERIGVHAGLLKRLEQSVKSR